MDPQTCVLVDIYFEICDGLRFVSFAYETNCHRTWTMLLEKGRLKIKHLQFVLYCITFVALRKKVNEGKGKYYDNNT